MTKDHIPPQELFPSPRPNLVTVPACPRCHRGTSKDDEYFRLKLLLRHDVGDHPKARQNWDAIFRSLLRPEAPGLRRLFFGDFQRVPLRTPGGGSLGHATGYDVDLVRIRRTVERFIRGLYFAERATPLGSNNEVRVYLDEDLQEEDPSALESLTNTILRPLAARMRVAIGGDVFHYWFYVAEQNPAFSAWLLRFYSCVSFLGLTGPPSPSSSDAVHA